MVLIELTEEEAEEAAEAMARDLRDAERWGFPRSKAFHDALRKLRDAEPREER